MPAVDGYQITDEIGRGGMGVVYRAEDIELERVVAIKTLLAGIFSGPEQLARLSREARVLANLEHPGILRIHGSGQTGGLPYLILEYVDGSNLHEWTRHRRLTPEQSVWILVRLAEAIDHAHQSGVIHRDLKPSNVLIKIGNDACEDMHVKIGDFGLAAFSTTTVGKVGSACTLSGSLLGTPAYMAPEQVLLRGPVGPPADIYALGAILYELLTGRPPFHANNPAEILRQVTEEDPISPTQLDRTIPKDLESICLKCLAHHPQRRYASAQALAADLRRWQNDTPVLATPERWIQKLGRVALRHRVQAMAFAVMILVVLGAMGAVIVSWRQTLRTNSQLNQTVANLRRTSYFSGSESAWQAWRTSDVDRARQILDELPREYRNFEWFFLHSACNQASATLRLDLSPEVRLAISPDSSTVAYVNRDRDEVRVIDTLTRRLSIVGKVKDRVTCLCFASTGAQLLAGDASGSIMIFDTKDPSQVDTVKVCPHPILALSSHPSRPQVAWAGATSGGLFDPISRTLSKPFAGGAVADLKFDATGSAVLCAYENGSVYRWDIESRTATHWATLDNTPLKSLSVGTENRVFAGGHSTQWSWHDALGNRQQSTLLQTGINQCVMIDETRLVTAGRDSAIRVWDAIEGSELFVFRGHSSEVTSVVWNPTTKEIVSASDDGTIRFWNPDAGNQSFATRRVHDDFTVLDVAPGTSNSSCSIVVGAGKRLLLFDDQLNPQWEKPLILPGDAKAVRQSHDGKWVVASVDCGASYQIIAVERATKSIRRKLSGLSPVADFKIDGDGDHVYCRSSTACVQAWNLENGRITRQIGRQPALTYSVDVSADGRLMAAKTNHSQLRIWDLKDERLVAELNFSPVITRTRFSPDGKTLAVGGRDGAVRLLTAPDWQVAKTFADAPTIAGNLAFSPDGSRLAVGQTDGIVRLWDVHSGQRVMALTIARAGVTGLEFTADGRQLFATTGDGFVVALRIDARTHR
ncbi:MAG: serine/threonine-protein kinase [Planctomycetota bacterium]